MGSACARIAEEARAEMGSDSERVAQALLRRLRALSPDDIEQFQEQWEQVQDDLDRWSIGDAATLLLGPIDDLLAMQDWIISHGRETVRCVQEDPDSLVSLAPDRHNATMDWFGGSRCKPISPSPERRSRLMGRQVPINRTERRST